MKNSDNVLTLSDLDSLNPYHISFTKTIRFVRNRCAFRGIHRNELTDYSLL